MPEDARRFGSGPCGFRSGESGVKVKMAGEGGEEAGGCGNFHVVGDGEEKVEVTGEL